MNNANITISDLPCDIQILIGDFLTIKDKCFLEISDSHKILNDIIYIRVVRDGSFLTDELLKKDKFSKLVELNLSNNNVITDLNHLSNTLRILNIGYESIVNDDNIKNCLLIYNIDVSNNKNITALNHLSKTLKIVNISGYYCGVNNEGIKDCLLITTINICYNQKINNLNFLSKTLKKVIKCGDCGIDNEGIKECKLINNREKI